MSARTRMWVAVAALDAVALVAIIVIGVHNVWTPGPAYPGDGGETAQARLIDTWLLVGLVPAFVATAGAAFADIHLRGRRK